jgi:predicted nucleotidyltransferase
MTNTLKIDSGKIPNLEVRDVIHSLNKVFEDLGIEYYIIGARSRDFWFSAHDLPPHRFTRDIDFAVLVSSIDHYNQLIQALEKTGQFGLVENIPHRVTFIKDNFMVDLLPFGEIGQSNYIHFKDKFDTQLSILGFNEVFDSRIVADFGDDLQIKLATLPGLCILKLLAWNDKPENRMYDIEDIYSIVKEFFDIESEAIYNDHADLFNDNFDKTLMGARVLGRQMAEIMNTSKELKERITGILEQQTSSPEKSKMSLIIAQKYDIELENAVLTLKEMLKGIADKIGTKKA